ncbi:MAG: adenylate/guanylate cyclase domain-containing protein [Myxococcales bacterium]
MTLTAGTDVASYLPRSLLDRVNRAEPGAVFEDMLASVLSVDIAGFTSLTDRLASEPSAGVDKLSRILNAFYGALIGMVEAHGGELVSIVGDGTIAVWPGAPTELYRATRRAASCGLELSRAFDGYKAADDTILRVRTGLGSGGMTVARLGGPERFELTVAGDAVTDAVAAEQLAAPGAFAVSPRAWPLLPLDKRGRDLGAGFMQVGSMSDDAGRPSRLPVADADSALLLSYLPATVRARIAGNTMPLWQAEVRHVSVAFFRFRTIDGRDLPLHQAQDAILLLEEVLSHYGGALDKINFHDKGCVATAAFGLPPHAYEDDARRAVAAALDTRDRARQHQIQLSVGVSSGLVFWGPIGHTARRQFALIGRAMTLGSRLMQRADGDVLCCPNTVEALSDRASGELVAAMSLKGFEQPIRAFRATAMAPPRNPRREMLGRTRERARLAETLQAARTGKGGVLWLEAGPGLGKSSLVVSLVADARAAGLAALLGAADSVEQATPYHAWKAPLSELLGIDGALVSAERVGRVIDLVDALPGMRGLAPLLAQLLALPIPDSASTARLDGAARADRVADLVVALIEREARERGMLIVLEDLHWFDSASLRVAQNLRKRLGSVPLVITSRPTSDAVDDLYRGLKNAAEVLPLEPLPETRILELVALRLGASDVSPDARTFINERANGNPLFAESLARELGAAGILKVVGGIVRLEQSAAGLVEHVPRSLDAIIGTRVDRLSPTDSLTLKSASAVGPTFQLEVVRAIHPHELSREQLLASLRKLETERLIVPLGKADSYAFDHAVTHEVTYTRTTPQQREALHAKIAEWHDRARAAESESHHPLLAYHYERAGSSRLACQFLSLAAEQALRAGAFREASRFLERAIELAAKKPDPAITPLRRARWHRQLAETLDSMGEKGRIGAAAREALTALGQKEPQSHAGQYALMVKDALAQTVALSVNFRVRTMAPEVAFELSRAHLSLTSYYFYAMNPLGMVANTLRATNASEHTGNTSERARCYSAMSLWLGIVGQQRLARSYAARAVKACGEAPDDPGVVAALCVCALFYVGNGDFDACERCCVAAKQEADPRNDHAWWCGAQAIYAWSLLYRGARQRFDDEVTALLERAKRADIEHLSAWAIRFKTRDRLNAANADEACAIFRDLLDVFQRHGDRSEELVVQSSLILALVLAGKPAEARRRVDATMQLLASMERPTSHIVLQGLSDLMEALEALAGWSPSDTTLRGYQHRVLDALHTYQGSFPIGTARAQHFLGKAELASGRQRQAIQAFERGLAAAERLHLANDVELLRADLAAARAPR